MCYCEHCRRNFKAFSGLESAHGRPARRRAGARTKRASNTTPGTRSGCWSCIRSGTPKSSKRNPGAAFFPNGFDEIHDSISVPILFADRQCRSEFQLPWQNGKFAKDSRATSGSKPIVGIFSVGFEAPYRWKDSTQNPNEVRMWAVDGIAQGFRPWVVKFNAKPLDHRWFKPVEDLYVWHWKNEKYLRNERPLARVGMVSAPRTAADHTSGFYHALVEARIPFEMVPDEPVRRGAPAAIPSSGAAQYRQPERCAVRAIEGLRRKRRRAGGHSRDFAQRRARQAPRRFRLGRPVRRVVCRQRDRAPAERLPESRRPLPSAAGGAR